MHRRALALAIVTAALLGFAAQPATATAPGLSAQKKAELALANGGHGGDDCPAGKSAAAFRH